MSRTLSIFATGAVAIVIALAGAWFVGFGSDDDAVGPPAPSPAGTNAPTASPTLNVISGLPGRFAFASDRSGNFEIYSMRPDRSELVQLTEDPADDREPAWSPDGARIAFTRVEPDGGAVWIMNADGSGSHRVTDGGSPQWSFDGSRIVAQDGATIFAIGPDGTGRTDIVTEPSSGLLLNGPSWLDDGTGILFIGSPGEGQGSDVYRVKLDGTDLTKLTSTGGEEASPRMSTDGRRIAFETHYACVCTMLPDGSDSVRLDAWDGKGSPLAWSPDGRWIATAGGSHGPLFIHVIDAADGNNRVATDTGDYADLSWGP